MKKTSRYTVLRDSREKEGHGWVFDDSETCTGTAVKTLRTGDYTLAGYEDVLAVERKGSVCEFVGNITQKGKWANFKDELERLEVYPAAFVVCEFTLDDVMRYPQGTNLPWAIKRRIRVSPQFYLKRLIEIELHFKAKVKMVGPTAGRDYVSSLFKRVVERWPERLPTAS
jgi:hypothetical protein